MSNNFCTNINTCRMVTTEEVVPDKKIKEELMDTWCRQGEDYWGECKRYITKKAFGFCPDFVVPATELSIDEIIDKFDADSQD